MGSRPPRSDGHTDLKPARIALTYAVVGLAWIFGTGYIVKLFTSGDSSTALEFGKGAGFVAVTAAALYIVLARRARSIRTAEQARAAADEQRIRLATAVEQAAEAVIITDGDARIQYVNPAFETISGYTLAELVGRNASLLGRSEDGAEASENLWSTLRSEETWHGNLVNRRRDGGNYEAEATISPIRDGQGRLAGFVGVERDVSLQRALERQLEEAGRMEAIGQLAGGIAHDFNNQLMAIAAYAEILRAEVAGNPIVEQDSLEILRATRGAATLVRQLLTLARRADQDPLALALDKLVTELRPMLDGLLGPRIGLDIHVADGLAPVWADPHQLEQVLVNLVVNARDAMPEGGTVKVSMANAEVCTENTVAAVVKPGRYVVITVADTGHGMDRATMARVFEPFFTTKPIGHGTGLGLATAYGIIGQSGGYLSVESDIGRGSTFTIHLPQHDGPAEADAEPAKVEPLPRGTETILLVEDEQAVRRIVTRTLERLGYRLLEAGDGDEAQAVWETEGPAIDLLVTDIRLPGLDGPSLVARLRSGRPDLRVLYVSGYAGDAVLEGGLVRPDEAFLGKPFGTDELARLVRTLLDKPAGPNGTEQGPG